MLLSPWPPVVASLVLSAVFIARSSFVVDGERFFVLADDPMISMTYARNLSEGHGLVWNPGERPVEGYTNPLWTVVMAVVHLVPLPDSKVSLLVMALGAAILVGTIALAARVAGRLAPGRPAVPAVAAWLTASFWPSVFWTLGGFEVGLLSLLVVAAAALALNCDGAPPARVLVPLGAVLAAGVLTRLDFVVPAAVITAFVALVAHRARVRAVLVVGGIVGAALLIHTAARLAYYGDALPNTYYLKATGVALSAQLSRGATLLFDTVRYQLALPLALGAAFLALRRRRVPPVAWLLAALAAGQLAYSVWVGGDAWEMLRFANRYVAVAAPALFVLAALGVDALVSHGAHLRARAAVLGCSALAVVVLTRSPRPAVDLHTVAAPGLRHPVTVAALLALAALAAALPSLLRPAVPPGAARRRSAAAGLAVAALVVAVVNAEPFLRWARHDHFAPAAEDFTRYGLALRAATPPGTTIAVAAAGAIPYFARRTFVDLLGKSDPVVAHLPARPGLPPGHNKWDYAYSVGQRRPDVVAEVYLPDPADLAAFPGWGYAPVAPGLFVRVDARVDRSRLARAALARL